jgi:drug/metabolite transporter (DMT)-like permease
VLLVGAFIQGQPLPPLSNVQAWLGVLGMTVMAQGFGHTLQNAALKHVRASIVGFSTLLKPVFVGALVPPCSTKPPLS